MGCQKGFLFSSLSNIFHGHKSWDFFLWPVKGFNPHAPWRDVVKKLTGFSGSSGFLLLKNMENHVGENHRGYFITDGRYTLQAQKEIMDYCGSSITLKEGSWHLRDIQKILEFLKDQKKSEEENHGEKTTILVSPKALSVFMAKELEKKYLCSWMSIQEEYLFLQTLGISGKSNIVSPENKDPHFGCSSEGPLPSSLNNEHHHTYEEKSHISALYFLHDTYSFHQRCEKLFPKGFAPFVEKKEGNNSHCVPKKDGMLILEGSWDIFWLIGARVDHKSNIFEEILPKNEEYSLLDPCSEGSERRNTLDPCSEGSERRNTLDPCSEGSERRNTLDPCSEGSERRNTLDPCSEGSERRNPNTPTSAPFVQDFSQRDHQKPPCFGISSYDIHIADSQPYNHPNKNHHGLFIPPQKDPLCPALALLIYRETKWHIFVYLYTDSLTNKHIAEALLGGYYHCVSKEDISFLTSKTELFQKILTLHNQQSWPLYYDPMGTSMAILDDLNTFSHNSRLPSDGSCLSLFSKKSFLPSLSSSGILQCLSHGRSEKSSQECAGMKWANRQESAALTGFLYWIIHNQHLSQETEYSLVQKLEEYRRKIPGYKGQSFDTISATGPHGALIHYKTPNMESSSGLSTPIVESSPGLSGPYLLDAGGHYCSFSRSFYGTTDISRSLWLGNSDDISQKYKEHYTRVLKSHIGGVMNSFPSATPTNVLDGITRAPLWGYKEDYQHGTSHGVGCYGVVHESPPNLGIGSSGTLRENMILSHEPGYYEENWGGIRLENLFLIKQSHNHDNNSKGEGSLCIQTNQQENIGEKTQKSWLSFEVITFVPFDLRAVLFCNLCLEEKKWLYHYYEKIAEKLEYLLSPLEYQWILEGKSYIKQYIT